MPRSEFTAKTKRLALARAGNGDPMQARCEAVGAVYGHEAGHRCNWPLAKGVEFDHYPRRAADGGDNSLENCAAVCPTCHAWKTAHFDTPMAAKGKRVSDKHLGIARTVSRLSGPGFRKASPQRSASRPIVKRERPGTETLEDRN